MATHPSFFEKLDAEARLSGSLLIVGLDPTDSDIAGDIAVLRTENPTSGAADAAVRFCKRIVTATAPYAIGYKPNSAFFEAYGAAGFAGLKEVIAFIRLTAPTSIILLDAKRGDISSTAEAYAKAAFEVFDADAVTINPYMGVDSIAPFDKSGKGIFLLCKTSNKSSNDIQTLRVGSHGKHLYEVIAEKAGSIWSSSGYGHGLVVGATDTEALKAVRRAAPRSWILAPGVGAQGGDLLAALQAGLRADGLGLLIPVSRGISQAADPAETARQLVETIKSTSAALASAHVATPIDDGAGSTLAEYQRQFIQAALHAEVLRFGSFTLKSGRLSPYFFNAGKFQTGRVISQVGKAYASAVIASGLAFDVLFGPAYKGIPLATAAACALTEFDRDVPVAYNRKEAKDHGEGGTLVGADIRDKRVLIIDDVITAGTAVNEAIETIKASGGIPVGVVVGLDRQERANLEVPDSAVQQVEKTHGIPVIAVVKLHSLIAFIEEAARTGAHIGSGAENASELLKAIETYRDTYAAASLS